MGPSLIPSFIKGKPFQGSRVYQAQRRLSKLIIQQLAPCHWVAKKENLPVTGAIGTGKTFLACAFAHQACLQGCTDLHLRLPRLFQQLLLAKGDGDYPKFIAQFAKKQLLILDGWGLTLMTAQDRRDLLEILDDRHNHSSTIITSQLPRKLWYESIGDATLADAILDRLVHNAHKIDLKGGVNEKTTGEKLEPRRRPSIRWKSSIRSASLRIYDRHQAV